LGVPALKCSAVGLSAASPRSFLAVGFPLQSLTRMQDKVQTSNETMVPDQNQHRVPQVYLRYFGYEDNNGQWMISTLPIKEVEGMVARGVAYVNQKSIASILAEQNLFDSDMTPGFEYGARDLEQMFGQLETHYPRIVEQVEGRVLMNREQRSMLIALLCSMLIRSKHMGLRVGGSLDRSERTYFIEELTRQMRQPAGELFKHYMLNAEHEKNVLNLALLAMMYNLHCLFVRYEMVFVHTDNPSGWWTSDEPVVYRYDMNEGRIFSDDTELYLPLTPTVLLFMHHKNSKVKEGRFRTLDDGTHVVASNDEFAEITQLIVSGGMDFVFFNREFRYKGSVEGFPMKLKSS